MDVIILFNIFSLSFFTSQVHITEVGEIVFVQQAAIITLTQSNIIAAVCPFEA